MASRPAVGTDLGRPEERRTAIRRAEPAPPLHTRRVVIEYIRPEIDGGRFPIKRTVGESVDVAATIFADGHDVIVAVLQDRHPHAHHTSPQIPSPKSQITSESWREAPMTLSTPGTDEWRGSFDVAEMGWHE